MVSFRLLVPDSDPELRDREEEDSDVDTLVAVGGGVASGPGDPSELGGVVDPLLRRRPLPDFPFPQLKNHRPDKPLPDLFFPEPEMFLDISSASARVRERELFSVRALLVLRLLPRGPPPPPPAPAPAPPPPPPPPVRLGGGRLRTLTTGRSFRRKLRWRLWYLYVHTELHMHTQT